ncbi:MAG: hypothetical protein J6W38_07095 [Prevotella sp.]|nr:hypothetical protein [Prevotella sp.]MBO7128954.1 hypothetical protein [Prevotella sp.]
MKRTVVILGVLLSLGLFWACSKSDETTPVQSPEGGTGETVTNVSSVENQTGGPSSSASSDENGEDETPAGSFSFPLYDAEIEYVSLGSLPEWLTSWILSKEEDAGRPHTIFTKWDDNNQENPMLFRGEWEGKPYYLIRDLFSSCAFCDTFYEDGTRVDFEDEQLRQAFYGTFSNLKRIYIKYE